MLWYMLVLGHLHGNIIIFVITVMEMNYCFNNILIILKQDGMLQ